MIASVKYVEASSDDRADVCAGEDAVNYVAEHNDDTPLEDTQAEVNTEKLCEFREILRDLELDAHLVTDIELSRWLKARSMDPKAAEAMFRKSLQWRQLHMIDKILDWEPTPELVKEFPFQICGFDNDGDQFGVITWSKWNFDSFIQSVPINQGQTHIRYFWRCLEVVKQIMRTNSTKEKTISSGIVVIDMEGLALAQFASKEVIEVVLEATRQYEANYPGFLKKAVVVNTPQIFTFLYQLMRPFLSTETQASVEIYGYYDDWRSALRALLPVEQLPSRHGGANTTVQPFHHNNGYIVKVPEFDTVNESMFKTTNIPAGQKFDLEFTVDQINTELRWAFRTDDYDVGFGVFLSQNTEVETEMTDFCRVDSHILLQRGSVICKEKGKYIFRFDNTSSWIRPKTLYYLITESVGIKTC